MRETLLRTQAIAAGKNAKHNLRMIRRNPDIMKPGKLVRGVSYLEKMHRFAIEEMKNARRAGRARLWTSVRSHIFILPRNKRSVNQNLEGV